MATVGWQAEKEHASISAGGPTSSNQVLSLATDISGGDSYRQATAEAESSFSGVTTECP